MKLGLHKPSPAMVVACISLFVALGGTSFAAMTLARNSVLSKHIKNGQIKRADLAANAVTGAKVANNALTGADVAEQSLGQVPSAALFAGLPPEAFERSTRVQYGRANGTSGTPLLLLSWPELGVEIRTDGDIGNDTEVMIVNTRPINGGIISAVGRTGTNSADIEQPTPGAFGIFGDGGGADLDFLVTEAGSAGRALAVRCIFNDVFALTDGEVSCIGVRSSAN